MTVTSPDDDHREDVTVLDHTDVGFVPERMVSRFSHDLTPATAANLIREFVECPVCGHDIDPQASDGKQSDRDVIWTDERSSVQPGERSPGNPRTPIDRATAHECDDCGTRLRLFAEEKAQPAHWSQIPDEPWASNQLWIRRADGDFITTNPGALCAAADTTQQ